METANENDISVTPKGNNKAALVSAIMNAVNAALCLGLIVFILALTFSGNMNYDTEDAGEAIGLIFVIILFLPIALIITVPAGLTGAILQAVRSIIYFTQVKSDKKSSLAAVIICLVVKILIAVPLLFGALLLGAIWGKNNGWVTYITFYLGLAAVISSFVATGFEFAARK
ncbi:MAG: hypothetical protein IJS67_02915 [Clostridia bacterium]|nr:hypothetical protein [Clostridia bacterium]